MALVPAGVAAYAGFPPGGFTSLAQVSYAVLARQIHTPFLVESSPGRRVKLTLIEAPLAPQLPAGTRNPIPGDSNHERFSLIFRGPQAGMIEARIHRFEHAWLGRFDLYVGRIGRSDAGGVYYEAVFNRPAPGAALAASAS